jgi:hypothetical protein
VETEVAICQIEPKLQAVHRHLAAKQIKQILESNKHNVSHKRQQHNLRQLKKTLEDNNLAVVKSDKSKAIVIIDKNKLNDEINNFIKENQIDTLNKDPTEVYQKQIQQAIQKRDTLIEKQKHRFLLNIKPITPQLKVCIKTHKSNHPIRPVINNIQAPTYKTAKFMNRKLQQLISLPYEYNVENSKQVAEEITKLQINENMRIITLDIKDMYVNLPTAGITQSAEFWLNKHKSNNKKLNQQIINMLSTITKQNYFQYEGTYYQPKKGIAMGSPISGLIAEI